MKAHLSFFVHFSIPNPWELAHKKQSVTQKCQLTRYCPLRLACFLFLSFPPPLSSLSFFSYWFILSLIRKDLQHLNYFQTIRICTSFYFIGNRLSVDKNFSIFLLPVLAHLSQLLASVSFSTLMGRGLPSSKLWLANCQLKKIRRANSW